MNNTVTVLAAAAAARVAEGATVERMAATWAKAAKAGAEAVTFRAKAEEAAKAEGLMAWDAFADAAALASHGGTTVRDVAARLDIAKGKAERGLAFGRVALVTEDASDVASLVALWDLMTSRRADAKGFRAKGGTLEAVTAKAIPTVADALAKVEKAIRAAEKAVEADKSDEAPAEVLAPEVDMTEAEAEAEEIVEQATAWAHATAWAEEALAKAEAEGLNLAEAEAFLMVATRVAKAAKAVREAAAEATVA